MPQGKETFEDETEDTPRAKRLSAFFEYFRMATLLLLWIFIVVAFLIGEDSKKITKVISLEDSKPFTMNMNKLLPKHDLYRVVINGPIIGDGSKENQTEGTITMEFDSIRKNLKNHKTSVQLNVSKNHENDEVAKRTFSMPSDLKDVTFSLTAKGVKDCIPLKFEIIPDYVSPVKSALLGALLLLLLYLLIIWEIVDRVFATIISSSSSLAVLCFLHLRPSFETIVSWIDIPTLVLLFSMMILVAILSDTGIFDVIAVFAYKLSRGHAWPMIYIIATITGILSAFLDNVTMMLLMTPVTIKLCEVMKLNVVNVLVIIVAASNIGGAMTPVGDPPNIIISNNKIVKSVGIDFMTFVLHIFPVVFGCLFVAFILVRLQLRSKGIQSDENKDNQKAEPPPSPDDSAKIAALTQKYEKLKFHPCGLRPTPIFPETLASMKVKYRIKDEVMLIKAILALSIAILGFCLHSLPAFKGITLEWAALLAAILLLILTYTEGLAYVIERIEWETLLFFANLFIIMECLTELGLIEWIGSQTIKVIQAAPGNWRLAVAILLIVWVSGIASAFIDNIPITQMMLKLCIQIYLDTSLNLPLAPLVWSLVCGTCFGGNGTLIGASANVVCAGLAHQQGYKFTFMNFFKIGFPITLSSLLVSSIYLQICHVIFKWH